MGLVSKIQRYATKDGPGLRTTVFLIGCNLSCLWCANPELITSDRKVLHYKDSCRQCGNCVQHAVNHSIVLDDDSIKIDRAACNNLEQMVDCCPHDAFEKIGQTISAAELTERVSRDRQFFADSGGGVTFSGGEPGLQSNFVLEAASRLQSERIHVALDTAGHLPAAVIQQLLDPIDLFLYDIKALDPVLHIKCTGTENHQILENARTITAAGKPMIVRMVLVPGWNDDWQDIMDRLDFIQSLGPAVQQVDILKYHKLGAGKYRALGLEYPLPAVPECSDAFAQTVLNQALERNLNATISG